MRSNDSNDNEALKEQIRSKTTAAKFMQRGGQMLRSVLDRIATLAVNLWMAVSNALTSESSDLEEELKRRKEEDFQNRMVQAQVREMEALENRNKISLYTAEKQRAIDERNKELDRFLADLDVPQELKQKFSNASRAFDAMRLDDNGQITEEFMAMEKRNKLEKIRESGGYAQLSASQRNDLAPTKAELDAEIRRDKNPEAAKIAANVLESGREIERAIAKGTAYQYLRPELQKKIDKMETITPMKDAGESVVKHKAREGGLLADIEAQKDNTLKIDARLEALGKLEKERESKEKQVLKEGLASEKANQPATSAPVIAGTSVKIEKQGGLKEIAVPLIGSGIQEAIPDRQSGNLSPSQTPVLAQRANTDIIGVSNPANSHAAAITAAKSGKPIIER